MQRVRPRAAGGHPDARRQCPLPVLLYAPGSHVLGLRPAAYRRGDHGCRPGLRLVLPGSAAVMRTLRADPQDCQAGDSIHPRPMLRLLPRHVGGLLGLRANQALPADLFRQPDLPGLPGPSSPDLLPVWARSSSPGGMARRTGLHRLLRACPPPPSRVRRMRSGTAAGR
jgi:hypothetical protein